MTAARPLLLAVDLDGDGAHPAAWRDAGRPPGAVLGAAALRRAVAAAEAAGFALATFADAPLPPPDAAGRLEAGTRAAFASTITDRIGLAPELHVTTTEPFHLATQLASLDHASKGRAAWVVGAAADAASLATIGAAAPDAAALRREVRDVIDVARALWDSWEDDAVIKESATGRYLDAGRVHHVDFEGASFTVKGPLITPRPPQGQVVVLAAASLDVDDRADVVLVDEPDGGDRAGLTFAEVEVVLAASAAEAADRAARLDEGAPWPRTPGRLRHVGTPAGLAEALRSLAGRVDGVRLHPAVLTADLPALARDVLPALASDGLHRPPAPGGTLRDVLGLPRPASRHTTAT
ncbi:LLM class flavin-dependent oxidoreductase [Actinomadura parmotrematis]|uniref:LLM class flavin-dependent oxidoreductase n=1 Tax=Actinomadura parmotrematis TaxID=2864039 RepID=A0ABS7G2K8_9ACTN|nr:LLM class flavin-dependent oxidoreductase [Actinomadura parmotrematis]MBW8486766.1 LLM class flavin-dependent oxidoreductase [Actinomadura parmotrematis]